MKNFELMKISSRQEPSSKSTLLFGSNFLFSFSFYLIEPYLIGTEFDDCKKNRKQRNIIATGALRLTLFFYQYALLLQVW